MEEGEAKTDTTIPRSRVVRNTLIVALVAALLLGGLYWRKHAINGKVAQALAGETDAETSVYRRGLIGGNDIVFDVQSVGGEMSMVAMSRRLMKSAEALKDQEFDKVYLAYRGNEKFYFEGSYFKRLGEERESQNPIYALRTMPENVNNLDGTPAFGTWTGGLIGVVGEQFEDNAEFHRKWWVDDALVTLPE